MTSLVLLMLAINATLVFIMLPRIYGDWLRFNCYRLQDEHEMLDNLLRAENLWVKRHFFCAFAATLLVVVIKRHPHLQGYQQLSDVTAAYGMVSLLFAFAESLFAQIIAHVAMATGRGANRR